jgi:hypothetical protein
MTARWAQVLTVPKALSCRMLLAMPAGHSRLFASVRMLQIEGGLGWPSESWTNHRGQEHKYVSEAGGFELSLGVILNGLDSLHMHNDFITSPQEPMNIKWKSAKRTQACQVFTYSMFRTPGREFNTWHESKLQSPGSFELAVQYCRRWSTGSDLPALRGGTI